jgi:hypothetical protein
METSENDMYIVERKQARIESRHWTDCIYTRCYWCTDGVTKISHVQVPRLEKSRTTEGRSRSTRKPTTTTTTTITSRNEPLMMTDWFLPDAHKSVNAKSAIAYTCGGKGSCAKDCDVTWHWGEGGERERENEKREEEEEERKKKITRRKRNQEWIKRESSRW